MRQRGHGQNGAGPPPKPRVIVNGKPALDVQGDWALFSSSKTGRQYYFNLKTLVNQWTKPVGWVSAVSSWFLFKC